MSSLRACLLACCIVAAVAPRAAAAGGSGQTGYRLYEAAAATVNGEVLFRSDVVREACFRSCGAFPGEAPVDLSLSAARDKLVADTLVLQEQAKLELGTVDNAALRDAAALALAAMEGCSSPCAKDIPAGRVRDYVKRRLLVREFLRKRVSVFVEVNDEEVQREAERRASRSGNSAADVPVETLRKELSERKAEREIGNWFARTTSKSRIVLSPLEER